MSAHPYEKLDDKAYWKTAIANRHYGDLEGLAEPIPLTRTDRIATAGSCFAQHIGNRLAARQAAFVDYEPKPAGWTTGDARRHGFGIYSCRYGNIYTVRQLLQLAEEALVLPAPRPEIWEKAGRFYDALRPSVDPVGLEKPEDVMLMRVRHLAAVKRMLTEIDVLVFTMGLTEGWVHAETGVVYPVAPGTAAGVYDPALHLFHNFRYTEIMEDLRAFWALVKSVNPRARLILTISPVPLTATASGHHVLWATTYSKSTLRAVAQDFVADHAEAYYFPSYEIISSAPSAGFFFNPDKRTVNPRGVDFVMEHFFANLAGFDGTAQGTDAHDAEVVCDEGKLEQYAR